MIAKKAAPTKNTLPVKNETCFSTVQQTLSHFFPEPDPGKVHPKGRERGTDAAERAFAEIVNNGSARGR